jgi:chemotaxis protein histidine kinase CheA
MNRLSIFFALAVALAMPAAAQEVVAPPTPNADRLAEAMRTLAREPRDVRALLTAGEMSARLNDPAAAAGFFARAQALDPGNPRVLAGQAMVMVRMERPGEALRLFDQAARAGLTMDEYASDRGFAYDLVGAQAHAQRDHRAAMRRDPDDETIRRFALSLGISGKADEAAQVLDPLLRRTDRAAWRARAFILAMNGDAAGADKIAASMMGGFGTALSPFFRKLPTLSAADKAFAVHFGEMRRTPARIADAGLAPPLPQLAPERPALAAAAAPRVPQAGERAARPASRRERRRAEEKARREAAARAAVAAREAEARRVAEAKAAQEAAAAQREREALAARQQEAQRLAAEQQAARDAETRRLADAAERERAAAAAAAAQAAQAAEAAKAAEAQAAAAKAAEDARAAEALRAEQEARSVAPAVAEALPAPVTAPLAEVATAQPAVTAPPAEVVATAQSPSVAPAEAAAAQASAAAVTEPAGQRVGGEDNVIARIIAGITIPASELGVRPMPGQAPAPAPEAVQPPVIPASAGSPEAQPVVAPRPDPAPAAIAAKEPRKKPAPAKPKPDPAKAEPARHWVQVAGGANVGGLPREWQRLKEKAPEAFRGKQAWTTPLRFTNRLLTGPFKTSAEAQAFVNTLGKQDVSAFAWTSEAGQKIEKLPAK